MDIRYSGRYKYDICTRSPSIITRWLASSFETATRQNTKAKRQNSPRVTRQAPVRLGFDCSVLQAIAEDQDIATS